MPFIRGRDSLYNLVPTKVYVALFHFGWWKPFTVYRACSIGGFEVHSRSRSFHTVLERLSGPLIAARFVRGPA